MTEAKLAELRQLDVEIATKILGYEVEFLNQRHGWRIDCAAYKTDDSGAKSFNLEEVNSPIMTDYGADGYRLKYFSKDIRAAFELITYLEKLGKAVILQNDTHELNKVWSARNNEMDHIFTNLIRGWHSFDKKSDGECAIDVEAETLPEAICLFMLEAKEKGLI